MFGEQVVWRGEFVFRQPLPICRGVINNLVQSRSVLCHCRDEGHPRADHYELRLGPRQQGGRTMVDLAVYHAAETRYAGDFYTAGREGGRGVTTRLPFSVGVVMVV